MKGKYMTQVTDLQKIAGNQSLPREERVQAMIELFKAEEPKYFALFKSRVSRGAEWFDLQGPGWALKITKEVIVYSPHNGVEEQVGMVPPDLVEYGLKPINGDLIHTYGYTERAWLGIFWKQEIASRV